MPGLEVGQLRVRISPRFRQLGLSHSHSPALGTSEAEVLRAAWDKELVQFTARCVEDEVTS